MTNQPAQPTENTENKAAIPMATNEGASDTKKLVANLIMIGVIVFFAGSGIYLFKDKLFGGGDAGGGGVMQDIAPTIAGKPVWDKPRDILPMGQYTQIFRKPRSYVFTDKNGARHGSQFYLHEPKIQPGSTTRYPVVIFLHDEKGMADGAVSLLTRQVQQIMPAFILVPMTSAAKTWAVPEKYQGTELTGKSAVYMGLWSARKYPKPRQALDDVLTIVAAMQESRPIDDTRIYIAGCGEGALGVYGALSSYPELFAGGVAVSGMWSYLDAPKLKQTPLVIMHGGKDVQMPAVHAQTMASIIKQMGGTQLIYREIPDLARNCADPRLFTPAVWQWLAAQKKAGVAPETLDPAGYVETGK